MRGAETLSISRDGKLLAVGTLFGAIILFEFETGNAIHKLGADNQDKAVNSLAFSFDGQFLASTQRDFDFEKTERVNPINIWTVANGKLRKKIYGHTKFIWNVSFAPNDNILASASYDGTIRVWVVD